MLDTEREKLPVLDEEDDPEASWIKCYWRPLMAMQYLCVCVFDFMAAPILTGILSAIFGIPYVQWHPITLEGGGLYHMAMAAIVGITAYTRGMEKIERIKTEITEPRA